MLASTDRTPPVSVPIALHFGVGPQDSGMELLFAERLVAPTDWWVKMTAGRQLWAHSFEMHGHVKVGSASAISNETIHQDLEEYPSHHV